MEAMDSLVVGIALLNAAGLLLAALGERMSPGRWIEAASRTVSRRQDRTFEGWREREPR